MKTLLWVISTISCIIYVNSLYFHLYRDEKRCFYDEYYTDTVNIFYFIKINIIKVLLIRYDVLEKTSLYFQKNNDKRIQLSLYFNDESEEESQVKLIKKFESEKLKGKFSSVIQKSIYKHYILFFYLSFII